MRIACIEGTSLCPGSFPMPTLRTKTGNPQMTQIYTDEDMRTDEDRKDSWAGSGRLMTRAESRSRGEDQTKMDVKEPFRERIVS